MERNQLPMTNCCQVYYCRTEFSCMENICVLACSKIFAILQYLRTMQHLNIFAIRYVVKYLRSNNVGEGIGSETTILANCTRVSKTLPGFSLDVEKSQRKDF